jgi:hypothetical protein
MTNPSLPTSLQKLREWLEMEGFDLIESQYRDSDFGNTLLLFRRHGLSIRMIRDRGQWFVEAADADVTEWFSPMVWRAYLDGRVGAITTPTIDEQCQMFEDDLERIQIAISTDPDVFEHLRSCRAERAQSRRG